LGTENGAPGARVGFSRGSGVFGIGGFGFGFRDSMLSFSLGFIAEGLFCTLLLPKKRRGRGEKRRGEEGRGEECHFIRSRSSLGDKVTR